MYNYKPVHIDSFAKKRIPFFQRSVLRTLSQLSTRTIPNLGRSEAFSLHYLFIHFLAKLKLSQILQIGFYITMHFKVSIKVRLDIPLQTLGKVHLGFTSCVLQ